MPLSPEVEPATEALRATLGDFILFGILLNPQTGEMGTYSSAGLPTGAVLGFLQQAITHMTEAMAAGELEISDGSRETRPWEAAEGTGGNLVH